MIQSGPMTRSNHKHLTFVYHLVKIQLVMGLVVTASFAAHKHNINTLFSGIVGLILAIALTLIYAKIAFGDGLISAPSIAYLRCIKKLSD